MEEEKNKNEECPLCQVSDETLNKLKEKNKGKESKKSAKKKKGLLRKLFRR